MEKIKEILSKVSKDLLATILGIGTSLCTAYAVIDFSTFDIKKDWMKLIIIGLPAIGGWYSEIKSKKDTVI